ncbi:MAG TPA: hypothetical protein VFD82_21965 [Planctomycetota bacterium]|nr:hypothetical protein [Planctomycetota bacterium]
MRHIFFRLVSVPLVVTTMLPAQGQDPREEIKEIARSIDEQLQEIDKLLLESSKKNQARATPKDLLQKAHERSTTAESGIDQLIEKLNEMKQRGQGSSQGEPQEPQDQPQGQPRDQQGQGQQNRRENQNPDYVKQPRQGQQPGQKPEGQKPDQKPTDGRPEGGQEAPGPGENTRGNRQLEPEIGPPNPGQGSETWGELQPYASSLKNRGSAPTKVPEQYRKYWEAYLRQKQGKPAGK